MLASSLLREPAHQALFVAIPFVVITRFGKHPELVGLFTAAWVGGAVAGSGAGYAVLKRLSLRKVAILGLFGQALPLWVLPLSLGTPVIVAALAISGICNTLTAAPLSAVRSLLTPPSLRPQVNTAAVTVAMLAGVIGAGVAGPALQAFSLPAVLPRGGGCGSRYGCRLPLRQESDGLRSAAGAPRPPPSDTPPCPGALSANTL
jgi:predicted MFS family arabinose efflux permease